MPCQRPNTRPLLFYCPVCGEEHGAATLHKRIAKALETIDPKLVDAELRAKAASGVLRESLETLATAQSGLKICQSEIGDLNRQKEELTKATEEFRTNTLLGG